MTDDHRPGISGIVPNDLATWVAATAQPAYRAGQIATAVWRDGGATEAHDIGTLPAPLRDALGAAFRFDTVADTEVRVTDGGLTEKALHRLADGALVESVLMHYPARGGSRERHTLCISSQAGCAVGCPFCATGELGFGRDLETAEILDQVRHAARRLAAEERRLTNIVFMGMGEPLLNLDRVLAAVEALNDPGRFGLGARHITVSTSGVVPGIRRLTALGPQFTLAVSLHAARDALRDVLVPLNRRWPVAEVVEAARAHGRATGRRISYEVTMIGGVNDTTLDATAMADLLRGDHAHVNLIPMNPVAHTPWTASPMPVIEAFAATLRTAGIGTTIRRNRGQEIGAACGQLAAERAGEPAPVTVARRRERLVTESAAALRGERSHDPVPVGVGGVAMGTGRARIAASILDADLSNLAYAVRRTQKAGTDRIHLDVMDGHFVPNLTFGAKTIKALRPRTELPFDAHLMISEPGRYIEEYLDAGCDSITIHVEIEEPIAPTLQAIRDAGRAAGLCVKPGTPLSALEPYEQLIDIVMVMTVEPGFGGQSFMKDVAQDKLLAARHYLRHKAHGGEVHVDGGVNRETAEFAGGLGVDILVVGSALFVKGRDMAREIRLIRALADEGYQYTLNGGEPPIPRDKMVRFASLPKHIARELMDEIEAGGVPVVMLRGNGEMNPDGIRDYDLLVPATVEGLVEERHASSRDAAMRRADAWREVFIAEHGVIPPAALP